MKYLNNFKLPLFHYDPQAEVIYFLFHLNNACPALRTTRVIKQKQKCIEVEIIELTSIHMSTCKKPAMQQLPIIIQLPMTAKL